MAQLIWSQRPERRQMEAGIFTDILKNCPCGNLLCRAMLQWGSLIPRAALLKTFLPAPDSKSILLRTPAKTVAFWTDVSHTTQKNLPRQFLCCLKELKIGVYARAAVIIQMRADVERELESKPVENAGNLVESQDSVLQKAACFTIALSLIWSPELVIFLVVVAKCHTGKYNTLLKRQTKD